MLHPKEFHDLIAQGAVILVLGKASPDERKVFPNVFELSPALSPQAAIASVPTKVAGQAPIVLVLRSRANAAEWTRAWLDAFHGALYIFVDPGQRYVDFLDQQTLIASNANKPLQHPCGAF
jgi:hypothetical protein